MNAVLVNALLMPPLLPPPLLALPLLLVEVAVESKEKLQLLPAAKRERRGEREERKSDNYGKQAQDIVYIICMVK